MKRKITWSAPVFLFFPLMCFLAVWLVLYRFQVYNYEKQVYGWWLGITHQMPQEIQVDIGLRSVVKIYPNQDGIDWYGVKWSGKGTQLEVFNSANQINASTVMTIDPRNPEYPHQIKNGPERNIFGMTNKLPFSMPENGFLWSACPKNDYYFWAKSFDDNVWEPELWKGNQHLKTFPRVRFVFGRYKTGFMSDPVGMRAEYSNFSPDCRYFTMDSTENTWLLDTTNLTFAPLDIGATGTFFEQLFSPVDMECSHCFQPVWGVDSRDFIFSDFGGFEKYEFDSKRRSWVVLPGDYDDGIRSSIGEWLLGMSEGRPDSIISLSASVAGQIPGCEDIPHPGWSQQDIKTYYGSPVWSPVDDRLAYLCWTYDRSTCEDGKCDKKEGFLVIWDFSSIKQ